MDFYTYREIGDLANQLRQLSSRVYVATTLEEKDKLSSDIGKVAEILDEIRTNLDKFLIETILEKEES